MIRLDRFIKERRVFINYILEVSGIEQTIVALVESLIENPVTGPLIVGAVRSVTGWLQYKWKMAKGEKFDRGTFGATLLKYEIAVNAVAAVLPADFKYISALVLVADILGSWGRKLLAKR